MDPSDWLVVIDMPSIKQYVFGTDALAEIRGASSLLDRLNRQEMGEILRNGFQSAGGRIDDIYANGGGAQFIARQVTRNDIDTVLRQLSGRAAEMTGGQMRLAFGVADCSGSNYRDALNTARYHLRCHRENRFPSRTIALLPLFRECQSSSHLPASHLVSWGGGERLLLSDCARQKRDEARQARRHGVWAGWMRDLASLGPWPEKRGWDSLRCSDIADIGATARLKHHIGLVYADGNAMGRIVRQLDSPETCRAFSRVVDSSIREACYSALGNVCQKQIELNRSLLHGETGPLPLPADILLLGGDDLLVLLPADKALSFAIKVTKEFNTRTRQKIAGLEDERAKAFFEQVAASEGFTISCGVAIARATYPFYLLLDLAEDLLKSAKSKGTFYAHRDSGATPAFIDFHQVAGATSHQLSTVRQEDYQADSDAPRTLRPYSPADLEQLRGSVLALQDINFPRSKLHDLLESALDPSRERASRRLREIFSRLRQTGTRPERKRIWEACRLFLPSEPDWDFPWFQSEGRQMTLLADIVETFDLFTKED